MNFETDETNLLLISLITTVYENTLPDKPHIAAPFFGIQYMSDGLALVNADVDAAAAKLSYMVSKLGDLETYPHVISQNEIDCTDGIIEECLNGIYSFLLVAADAKRYKMSFECFD